MKVLCVLAIVLVAMATARHLNIRRELEMQAHEEVRTLFRFLQDALRKDPSILRFGDRVEKQTSRSGRLGAFVFTNCADPSQETLVASNITLKPDPVKIPGTIEVGGHFLIKSQFTSPLPTQLKVWKQVLGQWIEIPCLDDFGSCNYPDFCKIDNPSVCPPEFVKIGLPCKCPFVAGNWTLPSVSINIPDPLPIHITGGVRARLAGTFQNSLVTCVQVQFDLA